MSDGEGPRCALHFDAPSLATCSRCGRFSCQSCLVERAPALCTACAPAMVDPYGLRSQAFDFLPAFSIAFRLLAAELPKLFALVVLFSIPAAVVQVTFTGEGDDLRSLSASVRVSNAYEFFAGLIGSQAMLALLIARSEGRTLSLGGALQEGVQNWGRAAGSQLRSGLHILGFLLLLIIPGFWKATLLMFTTIAALRSQEQNPLAASEALVRGRFGLCLGFALAVLGVCFVPMLGIDTILGIIGEELSVPRFPLELLVDVIDRFASDTVMTSLFFVGYVMLHRTAGIELAPMRWRNVPPLLAR